MNTELLSLATTEFIIEHVNIMQKQLEKTDKILWKLQNEKTKKKKIENEEYTKSIFYPWN